MRTSDVSWFFESAADKNSHPTAVAGTTFGRYQTEGSKSFEKHFDDLATQYLESNGIDIKTDMKAMMADRTFMEGYKEDLMKPVLEGFKQACPGDPHIASVIENCNKFWDNKVRAYTESASITGFLPIATLEFPVLVKQFFSSILKDIIEVEAVKSPNITKHIRTTYLVDNQTGEELEYPKCMFDGTWQKMWNASKGLPIKKDVIKLTDGRLYNHDIVANDVVGANPALDKLSFDLKISAVEIGGKETVQLVGNGITVEFSTGGTLINGNLDFTTPNGTEVHDLISGRVDFKTNCISCTSASGQVTGIVLDGHLSNEKNLRSVSVRERREILRFTIPDGPRWNMPFSMEEIEDAAALLDLNYYNRMVDEIVRTQEMQECMTAIKFLNDEFQKYNGVKTDTYKLESMALTYTVDLKAPAGFAGDPFSYMAKAIQFKLKAIMHQLSELTKIEGISYVIVGNPMATQLISEFVDWKTVQGTTIGGIDVNNSYGFATDMGANVRCVATNLYEAYTADKVGDAADAQRELILHIYGYPTSAEHISFRHLKYTSHLFTSQTQTAYQSTQAPAGAFNIVTATSRFQDMAVQGIQADLVLLHSNLVYGDIGDRDRISGAPWTGLTLGTDTPVTPPAGGGGGAGTGDGTGG